MSEIPTATRPPQTTSSTDGTTIAFDVYGQSGPLVVIVGGATSTRLAARTLAETLAADGFTVACLDRRGRGDSTDTQPYAVQREIDDITAVIKAVRPGERAFLHGHSSGAALVLEAVSAGAPAAGASVFEPPYRHAGSPPVPPDYTGTLERLIAEGRNGDALEYFQVEAVGIPQEAVDQMKGTEFWDVMAATAPTLAYDGHCLGGDDQSFPEAMVADLPVPVLALASSGSPEWLRLPATMVGDRGPGARYVELAGDVHHAPDDVVAPVLAQFYRQV